MKTFAFLILGLLLFLAERLNKAMAKDNFAWKIFFEKNIIAVVLNLISGVIIIWGLDLGKAELMIGNFNVKYLLAATLGITGHVLFTAISGALNKKIRTKFGINEKK